MENEQKENTGANAAANAYVWPAPKARGSPALEIYAKSPDSPKVKAKVILVMKDWVVIEDISPKSFVHCLMICRIENTNVMHPAIALSDPAVLASAKEAIVKAKQAIADKLYAARWGGDEEAKQKWIESLEDGIHSGPSCRHIHIHVFSPDRANAKGRGAYKLFTTKYLIPLSSFPLPEVDAKLVEESRERARNGDYLALPDNAEELGLIREHLMKTANDLVCWRCQKKYTTHDWETLRDSHLLRAYELWLSGSDDVVEDCDKCALPGAITAVMLAELRGIWVLQMGVDKLGLDDKRRIQYDRGVSVIMNSLYRPRKS